MNKALFILILSFLIASVIIGMIFSIYKYTTLPGAILLFILLFWILLRKIVEISIFPGSNWIWKRGIEANYCKELSIQIEDRIKSLREYLENLMQFNIEMQETYIQNGKAIIISIIENYEGFNIKLSRKQAKICNMLKNLQENLEKTCIVINETDQFSLWDWLEIRLDCSTISSIKIPQNQSNSPINTSINICKALENTLRDCFTQKNCLKSLYRWLFDDTFGTIDYMKVDLIKRFNCEEISLKNGKINIDW